MTRNNRQSRSSLLKKVSIVMMIAGVVIFFAGFVLQFISIATMSTRNLAQDGMPSNFFAVIVTGFALLFSGVMVGSVDSMMKTRDVHVDMVETIRDKVMKGMHERMCETVEKYCAYCGTLLNENERDCPNCGASRTKNE